MFEDSRCCLAVAVVAAVFGGGAVAAPVPLSEADLDRVTAGAAADLDQLQRDVIDHVVLPRLLRWQAMLTGEPESAAALDTLQQLIDDLSGPSHAAPLLGLQLLAADDARATVGGAAADASRSIGTLLRGPLSISFIARGRNVPGNIVLQAFETESAAGASVSVEFSSSGSGASVIIPGGSASAAR